MIPQPVIVRRPVRTAAALAALLAMAACTGGVREYPGDPAQAAVGSQIARPAPPPVQPAALQKAKPAPAAQPEPLPDPAMLRGRAGEDIRRLMGTPAFTRADPPAALWQYRGTGCLLDLYLYTGRDGDRVRYFEFRPDPARQSPEGAPPPDAPQAPAASAVDARACLASLLRVQKRAAAP